MPLPSANPPLPAASDLTKNRYLQHRAEGLSHASASRAAGSNPTTMRRALRDDPTFADLVKDAEAQATGEVEDALFRKATGRISEERRTHAQAVQKAERERYEQTAGEDAKPLIQDPIPTHQEPDLKAIQFWLTRRDASRWEPDAAGGPGSTNTTVHIENFLQGDGERSLRETLQERRAALQAHSEPPAQPGTGGAQAEDYEASDSDVVDAEVLEDSTSGASTEPTARLMAADDSE